MNPVKTDKVLSAACEIRRKLFDASGHVSNFPRKFRNAILVRRLLRFYELTAMKQPTINPRADQNWNWPEKTWFQERLHAIKAREQELRRKPMVVSRLPLATAVKPESDQEPGAVQLSPKR